jgi:hypothetical protein
MKIKIRLQELKEVIKQVELRFPINSGFSDTIEIELDQPCKWHGQSDSYSVYYQSKCAEYNSTFICSNH